MGGNDQLVFDGNSIAVNRRGELIAQLPGFQEAEAIVDTETTAVDRARAARAVRRSARMRSSLGVRDYMRKCGFKSAVLGLSGGIDSAVVAAIAVRRAGRGERGGRLHAEPVFLAAAASRTRSRLRTISGSSVCRSRSATRSRAFKAQFAEIFAGLPEDTTEENMQSRLRGMILMSLSNKFGHILLTTGNKSELAVGYCTIYGDMAGGLAVISDVPKTMVYDLARWMNREREIIPRATIEKPPSAELKPDQMDQDTLPPYEILDEILRLYVEENSQRAGHCRRAASRKKPCAGCSAGWI